MASLYTKLKELKGKRAIRRGKIDSLQKAWGTYISDAELDFTKHVFM